MDIDNNGHMQRKHACIMVVLKWCLIVDKLHDLKYGTMLHSYSKSYIVYAVKLQNF